MRSSRVLSLLLASLAACGGGEGKAEGTWFHRLELAAEDGSRAPSDKRLVQHFAPAAEIEPWRVETDGAVSFGPIPDQAQESASFLRIFGDGDKVAIVPGAFDPSTFNRVDVTLLFRANADLTLSFRRGGKEVARSEPLWLPGADVPQLVSVPIAVNRFEREPYDELLVHVGKDAGPVFLSALDLVWQDWSAWLPQAGEEPELVLIGEESRTGLALSSARPLVARLPLAPGGALGWSFAGTGLARPEEVPVLEVVVRGSAGGEARWSAQLFPADSSAPAWSAATLSLSELRGDEATARFLLRSEGGRETVCALGEVVAVRPSGAAPAVLLVTSDTHRADHVGASGLGVEVSTPAIDALAARGTLFESAWSSSNVTIPSHAALMTGRPPRDTRVIDNRTALARAAPTLAERFRQAGFATLGVTSTRHLFDGVSGLGQGFDRMFSPTAVERRADGSIDLLERWLAEMSGRPLFVWLHLFDAHAPYDPPAEFSEPYVPLAKPGPDGQPDAHEVARMRYRGEVSYVDRELERALAHSRFADAIVGFTADHGESLGEHKVFFAHREVYPDNVHVPLILAGPGVQPGQRVAAMANQIDLGRTLLDLAGLERAEFPGQSLLALASGEAPPRPAFAISASGSSAAVTDAGWHLILHLYEHYIEPGKRGRRFARHEIELFHLEGPDPRRDVAAEQAERAASLRAMLVAWLNQAQEMGWAAQSDLDATTESGLEELGYIASETAALSAGWIDPACACEACEAFSR